MAGACASNARRWATQAAAAALPVDLLATFADDKNILVFLPRDRGRGFLAPGRKAKPKSHMSSEEGEEVTPAPSSEKFDGKVVAGAAAVGGVAAFVLAGPLVGLAAAGGAAYAATRNDEVGAAAKSTGKAALAIGDKAREINEEHKISDKVAEGAKNSLAWAHDMNERHDVSGKVTAGITAAGNWITDKLGGEQKK